MNKTAIKAFAVGARKKLIASVTQRAEAIITGVESPCPRLSEDIEEKGFRVVVEEVAYTWFKRIVGVRFMEVNGYLPGGVRVLSSEIPGQVTPDFLFVAGDDPSDEIFTSLFIEQCRSLAEALPDYFGSEHDYLEPLLNLSYHDEDGVVRSLVDTIAEDDFREAVEIVGWLYQYYNDERKNEVINVYGGRVKREDVPAATQFFTTDWVVCSMVDNSLGKYWLERNPQSPLQEKLKFYLGTENHSIIDHVSPQEVKILDPCMGSGHILVYAFDVLIEIYKECGYSAYDAAESILRYNLYGLDIDRRSFQLAYFALLMKARGYNTDILTRGIHLNLYTIDESNDIGENLLTFVADGDKEILADLQKLAASLCNAKEYGSIVAVDSIDFARIYRRLDEIKQRNCENLFDLAYQKDTAEKLLPLLKQAQVMAGKYEIVATNPPYLNKMDKKLRNYVNKHYRDFSGDLFSVFMYRNFEFCAENGYCAFMSPFVWMFIQTYEKLREYIIRNKSISSLIQLEYSAFEEATVPICTFVLKNGTESEPGIYLKLSDFRGGMEVQKQKVIEAIQNPRCGYRFETPIHNFTLLPGMPIAYWGSGKFGDIFADTPHVEDNATVTNGLFTCDNKRFLRRWYEVPQGEIFFDCESRTDCEKSTLKWYPYNKGGNFRKWYGNHEYVVNFKGFGREISEYRVQSGQSASFPGQNYYFAPSISWSFVSSSKFGVRYYPAGFVFDIAGSSVFVNQPDYTDYYLGFLSSSVAFEMLNLMNPTLNYQAGNIAKLPIRVNENKKARIDALIAENISLCKSDWDSYEVSWNFQTHPFLRFRLNRENSKISDAFDGWQRFTVTQFDRLKANEEELNCIFMEIYGLQDELTSDVEEKDITVRKADLQRDVHSFISYAVGCMFGRYESPAVEKNENAEFLLITEASDFENDIVSLFISFVRDVYGKETLAENLEYIAAALGGSGGTTDVIRSYFVKKFYGEHVKTYQKRPIYWLLDGGTVKVLFYIHSYHENTFSHVCEELVKVQCKLAKAAEEDGLTPKQKAKLLKQLEKLKVYGSKLKKTAAMHIRLDLDDGVQKNYSKVQGGEDLLPIL